MALGRFDTHHRAIVKPHSEFSRDQPGDNCRLIESTLFLPKAM
jgi:hypothetical protein